MTKNCRSASVILVLLLVAMPASSASADGTLSQADAAKLYPWSRHRVGYESLADRFAAPAGFRRVKVAKGSYAFWLRHLPLRAKMTPVRSYLGDTILDAGHPALAAVVDLDLSKRDRQQCADTIMRLRGEYLHAAGKADQTHFRWAGGKYFGYKHWRKGLRPVKEGKRRWVFRPKSRARRGYAAFRRYLEFMFSWTGTQHQAGERRIRDAASLVAGDFFVQGGSPGHAVVVIDIVENDSGHRRAIIGQGFMPAQDLHLMKGPSGSPWIDISPHLKSIPTPIWPQAFSFSDLRRFRY
jgi:hypothetical protein